MQGDRRPDAQTALVQGRQGAQRRRLIRTQGGEQQANHHVQVCGHQLHWVGHVRDGSQD